MPKITVRAYRETDANALVDIFYHTIHTINVLDYTDEQINSWAPEEIQDVERWRKRWSDVPPFVAVCDGKPVGFAELENNGHIDCFYVHHEHQGAGVGRSLMNRLHERAAMSGLERLFAEVSITARPFFAKCGFKVDKVNTVKKGDVTLRNFIMTRHISQTVSMMKMPVIETERIIARPAKYGDAIEINTAVNTSLTEIQRWMPWAQDQSLEATEQFVAGSVKSWSSENQRDFPMVIILKDIGKIIGASGFNDFSNPDVPYYDIGYWLETEHTGKGLATELVTALTDYAFSEMQAKRVQIRAQKENIKSRAVAQRCGFLLEAEMQASIRDCASGDACDGMIYARTG